MPVSSLLLLADISRRRFLAPSFVLAPLQPWSNDDLDRALLGTNVVVRGALPVGGVFLRLRTLPVENLLNCPLLNRLRIFDSWVRPAAFGSAPLLNRGGGGSRGEASIQEKLLHEFPSFKKGLRRDPFGGRNAAAGLKASPLNLRACFLTVLCSICLCIMRCSVVKYRGFRKAF